MESWTIWRLQASSIWVQTLQACLHLTLAVQDAANQTIGLLMQLQQRERHDKALATLSVTC